MTILDKIVVSTKRPERTTILWKNPTNGEVKFFNNGKWVNFHTSIDLDKLTTEEQVNDLIEKAKSEVIEKIVDSAPENLDTLKELSEALNNDDSFAPKVVEHITESTKEIETIKETKQDKLLPGVGITIEHNVITAVSTVLEISNEDIDKLF